MQQTKIWVASAVSLAYMTLFKCKSWLLLLLFVYLIAALVEQRPSGQGPWCLSWRKSIMVTFTARTVVYCKVLPKTLWNWWQRDLCVELWSGKQLSSHAPPIQLVQASSYPCHDSEHPSSESQPACLVWKIPFPSEQAPWPDLSASSLQGIFIKKHESKNLQILKPLMQNGTVRDLAEDGAERLEKLDNRGLALSSSLPAASEGVPPKSHQHAHPELIWTRMAPMHLPNWWRKSFKPYTKNYRQGGKMGAGEAVFLRTEHTNHHPVPSGQHRKHPCQQHSMDSIG